jgi:uncharacterized protein
MFARPLIDGIDFARNGKELRGEVPYEMLSRLSDMLFSSRGTLSYVVRGLKEENRYILEVVLNGVCQLRCQRCLGELAYPFNMASRLQLVSAEQLNEFDSNDEVDCIEAKSQMDVLALLEDELLLGIPFAPKHPEDACLSCSEGFEQFDNSFSILRELNKKH